MMELTVKIEANELTQAILKLASAIGGSSSTAPVETATPTESVLPTAQATMPSVPNIQPPAVMPTAPTAPAATPMQNAYAVPTAPTAPAATPMQNAYAVPTAPVQAPVVSAPISQPITAPTAPTSVPSYTIEQLQTAIAPLLDAGKVQQIQALVQSFGVNTLMDIPQERYGEFANGLRSLGGVL